MKNLLAPFSNAALYTLSFCLLFLSACSESPEKFFDITILNTNVLNDFASPTLARHINDETKEFPDIPSSKKNGTEAATTVQNKILYLEQSLAKIKALSPSGDEEKAIQNQAAKVYEMVLPVYKNEYINYAKLCDAKGSEEDKKAAAIQIEEKYAAAFEKAYADLLEKGKAYASKHNIQVNWGQ